MSATLDEMQSGVGDRPSPTSLCLTSDSFRIRVFDEVFASLATTLPDAQLLERGLFLLGEIRGNEIDVEVAWPKLMVGTTESVKLRFDVLDQAEAFATRHGRVVVGDAHTHPTDGVDLPSLDDIYAMQSKVEHLSRPYVALIYGPRYHVTLDDPWRQSELTCWVAHAASDAPYGGR